MVAVSAGVWRAAAFGPSVAAATSLAKVPPRAVAVGGNAACGKHNSRGEALQRESLGGTGEQLLWEPVWALPSSSCRDRLGNWSA